MNNQLFNSPCNFCDRDSTKEILSELEPLSRKFVKVKLCDACYKSYMTGNKFGQVQIHQNLLSVILGAEDEAPVLSLKEKLAEVAPFPNCPLPLPPQAYNSPNAFIAMT